MKPFPRARNASLAAVAAAALFTGWAAGVLGNCGPFTDVAADAFCPFVLEIFYLGITTGTTATTYDPTANVSRLQMAAFLSRTVDGTLKRGSRRAALDQFWTTQNATVLGTTSLGGGSGFLAYDGADIWSANFATNTVSRVRSSDGRLLETWTGAAGAGGIVVAMGRVLVASQTTQGNLYRIDPAQPAGAVTTVASNLGSTPLGIAFDGARVWTANNSGSVSIVTPGGTLPWTVTTVTTGFNTPRGVVFDGANIWVTDLGAGSLLKLDSAGAILQTTGVGSPLYPFFDGTNIWVPRGGAGTVTVVRASSGTVLLTLTGNGLNSPFTAGSDGERVLVANHGGDSVSLWKAADLTPLGSFAMPTGSLPFAVCSDGVNFWISLSNPGRIARF